MQEKLHRVALKAPEEEKQEMTVSLAAVKDISMAAAVGLDSIFTLKEQQQWKLFFCFGRRFAIHCARSG